MCCFSVYRTHKVHAQDISQLLPLFTKIKLGNQLYRAPEYVHFKAYVRKCEEFTTKRILLKEYFNNSFLTLENDQQIIQSKSVNNLITISKIPFLVM